MNNIAKIFLFALINGIISYVCTASQQTPVKLSPLDTLQQDLLPALTSYRTSVSIRRDTDDIRNAGSYFSGKALIQVDSMTKEPEDSDVESVVVDFNAGHSSRLDHMDQFLKCDGWKRNHLSADMFVLVYDSTDDEKKVIEGTILARKEAVPDNEFTFAVRPNNTVVPGYKFADFVSSPVTSIETMGENAASYEFIDNSSLKTVTDDGNHGDRLALDTIKTNPHLFFNLMRRSPHREDLKIISMGTRYTSSYDACNGCFKKIYDSRISIQSSLNAIAQSQGYSFYQHKPDFPVYTLFYSARPYFKLPEKTYTAFWKDQTTQKGKKFQTNIPYRFPGPTYHLDLIGITDLSKSDQKTITLDQDVIMDPATVYLKVRELSNGAICYETEDKSSSSPKMKASAGSPH